MDWKEFERLAPVILILLVIVLTWFQAQRAARKRCPECAEIVMAQAKKCIHCGSRIG